MKNQAMCISLPWNPLSPVRIICPLKPKITLKSWDLTLKYSSSTIFVYSGSPFVFHS
ncbi:MAG: hypothetical protein ACTSRD_09565 [Promethearchaeota archaeon]